MKTKHKVSLYHEKTLTSPEYGTWARVIRKYFFIGLENLKSLKDDESSPGEKQK
jgi:hypothetical protein